MKLCVMGLWHLGTVTSACLASVGHEVVALDLDTGVVQQLRSGHPPLFEPGLEQLVQRGLAQGGLSFTTSIAEALRDAELVWITYDTPVDEEDRADVQFVVDRVTRLFPHLGVGVLVLISSQLPVGTTRRVEQAYTAAYPEKPVTFGYSPENLRLGKAIDAFSQPDRVVVGLRTEADRERVKLLLRPLTDRIEWMSVESAEMTKHALNAFLATSVAFANEIAALCEQVGADAKEVERGLKSEVRIGPRAYLAPGPAFAGGTLARDIGFLTQLGAEQRVPTYLLPSVRESNIEHRNWVRRKLQSLLGSLGGSRVAVWGLTYKPGTDTLRRSSSVELCEWLAQEGAEVHAHDPGVRVLPEDLAKKMILHSSPLAAIQGADVLVVATEWPEYRDVACQEVLASLARPLVLDAGRFLEQSLGADPRIQYVTVGRPSSWRAGYCHEVQPG